MKTFVSPRTSIAMQQDDRTDALRTDGARAVRSRQAEQRPCGTRTAKPARPERGASSSEAHEAAGAGAGGLAVLDR